MNKSGVAFVCCASLRMLMPGCLAAVATNTSPLSLCMSPSLAFSTHSQVTPPTPFSHLATCPKKTKCHHSGSGFSYLLASLKTAPGRSKKLKRLCFLGGFFFFPPLVLCVSSVFLTVAGPVDSCLRGFSVGVGGWRTREATGCINYLTTCLKRTHFHYRLLFTRPIIWTLWHRT